MEQNPSWEVCSLWAGQEIPPPQSPPTFYGSRSFKALKVPIISPYARCLRNTNPVASTWKYRSSNPGFRNAESLRGVELSNRVHHRDTGSVSWMVPVRKSMTHYVVSVTSQSEWHVLWERMTSVHLTTQWMKTHTALHSLRLKLRLMTRITFFFFFCGEMQSMSCARRKDLICIRQLSFCVCFHFRFYELQSWFTLR